MDSSYRIELAASQHLALLPQIEVEAAAIFPAEDIAPELRAEGLSVATFEAAANEHRLWTVVENASGRPVGFALAKLLGGQAHLYEMDVLPAHARRGLGAALVEAVARWARDQGHSGLTLTTFRHLPWNAPFYRRLGFQEQAKEDLSAELSACLKQEAEAGLDPAKRVAMCRQLVPERES